VSEPRLKRDWVGRYVRLRRDLETQDGVIFDAGEVMQVYKTYHGRMGLRALHRCEHCERRALSRITGVETYNLEILPEDYQPPEVEPLVAEVERLRTRNAKLVALLREAGDGDCPFCEKVGGEDGHWNDCPLGATLAEEVERE